jgi:AcrR family transcriptional regulator
MQEKKTPRPNAQRSEEMRARLIAVARSLFSEKGVAETGTPEIVKRAEVTRGALYHHFVDKTDLFRAVVRAEATALSAGIMGAAQEQTSPDAAMRAGIDAFFRAMSVPGRARLLLIEGPAVLGVEEMDTLDAGEGRAVLAEGLAAMRPDLARTEIEALAVTLSAAFDRAALAVAGGGDGPLYREALMRLTGGLARGS